MDKPKIIPLFTDAESGTFLADMDIEPKDRLQWKYRTDDRSPFTDIMEGMNEPMRSADPKLRIVRVMFGQLPLGKDVHSIELQVSKDGAPSDPVAVQLGELAPITPVDINGHGQPRPEPPARAVEVSMTRAKVPFTKDEILWSVIRASTNALSVNRFIDFMDTIFVNPRLSTAANKERNDIARELGIAFEPFTFPSVDSYRVLRIAAQLFVLSHCGVMPFKPPLELDVAEEEARFGHHLPETFKKMWLDYLVREPGGDRRQLEVLPYLDLIRRKLGDIATVRSSFASIVDAQSGLLQEKLVHPPLLELVWSYWMEEGMLIQTFNSIIRRFQNLRAPGSERDPLAQLEIDPLRPLAHLMWGWSQDETDRLSVLRRALEYDHEYGFTLHGKAVADMQTAERRSKFLESFHNLLWRCTQFYRQDDDTTVVADGFPVLNALKETHYLLSQGAHNQFPDLATTARQEMLTQMWILSRPEMREFLGTRVMVAYPEPWMDRVDSVKTLKGWTDTSVVHFRDLAVFGEQVLLSVRYGAWSLVNEPAGASNWARYWRAEIQGYIHAYRAATGVDLTADITDQRQAETRFLPPSVHLRNRLLAQSSPTTR